jgi:type II secretory pathway predicted ATPase ExeA
MNADKANLKPGHILSAIHIDLTGDALGGDLERRTRKVHKLLLETARQDQHVVLILEEAHDIPKPTLRILKRLYDYEHGFRRPLAIILLGQTELAAKWEDAGIREISRRCTLRIMRGIKGETEKYLQFKFSRAGARYDRIFAQGAAKTIEKHCMGREGQFVSPLTVNVLASLAMNKAADADESRITPEFIDQACGPFHILK